MVIVQLNGGLGNQMFQYAAGMSLATHRSVDLKVDISALITNELRDFELLGLNVIPEIASDKDRLDFIPSGTFSRVIERIKPYPTKRFYKQSGFGFDKRFFDLGKNVYLKGFFQSEKYFQQISDKIREGFRPKGELLAGVNEKGYALQTEQSVAIHVRRGDYNKPEAQRYHGILTSDYYRKAIQQVKSRIDNPQFYIFSDDPDLPLKDMGIEGANRMSGKITKTHFEDLYLMSKCQHNIIANSSFSWWGAWLNNNPDKIVVAPKKWFDLGPGDTEDLIPEGWIKL